MSNLDIIHERLGGKRYERYVMARCIFHDDQKPSLFIFPDRYFCAACQARGTTESLVRQLNLFPERISVTTTRISANPFTRWLSQLGSIYKICNFAKQKQSLYLEERGIPRDIQKSLGIGILENWIVFPIYDHYGDIVGAVARRGQGNVGGSKYILPAGQKSELLYVPSWSSIREQSELFVTFGIIDAISLYILGKASASTTTGQHINVDAFSGIHKKITFIPDELEEKSAYQLASKLGLRGSVKILDYPYGTKDPADLFMYDRQLLEAAL